MAEKVGDDPFDWEVDRVAQELCTTNRIWPAPAARRLPDPATLEISIREQELDGESLLTYGDVFGIEALWSALGIKKAPHRLSINAALLYFKKRSNKYHDWKRNQSETSLFDDDDGPVPEGRQLSGTAPQLVPESNLAMPPSTHDNDTPLNDHSESKDNTSVITPTVLAGAKRSIDESKTLDTSTSAAEDVRPAKKRAVLTTISTQPIHDKPFSIPTEADELFRNKTKEPSAEEVASPYVFLGAKPLLVSTILQPSDSVGDEREFFFGHHRTIPAGRRIQIATAMRQFLRHDPLVVDIVDPAAQEDAVLPLYGDSDDEESIDSETWEAYLKEEKHLENRKSATKSFNVAEVVDHAIETFKNQWITRRQPAKDRAAHRLWEQAGRGPYRQALLNSAKQRLANVEKAIDEKRTNILKLTWDSKQELVTKLGDWFKLSVWTLQYQKWLVALYQNPVQPPKVQTNDTQAKKPRQSKTNSTNSDDEESIATDSDDNEDDWIEQDEPTCDPMDNGSDECLLHPRSPSLPRAMDQSPPQTPSRAERFKSEYPGVKQTPARISSITNGNVIEILSSPATGLTVTELPALHELEKIEEIGFERWERVGDKERLVVAILSSWPQARTTMIFNTILQDNSEVVWEATIQPCLEEIPAKYLDTEGDTASFCLLRLFDCYISCTAARHLRGRFSRVTLQRILREKPGFDSFCRFLRSVSPHFGYSAPPSTPVRVKLASPQSKSSKEKRSALLVDSDADQEDTDDGETRMDEPHMSSTKKKKVVRIDAKAKEVRDTNLEQLETFDERRRLLRQQLAASGEISSDKARLIVNETKEDKYELIYLNDHTGRKIKDHQIEGVRFLWNHVVAKSNLVRQGCLLAHEMGLGKTMQAITLLVVIAEASRSKNPMVYEQIPEDLRTSKTLILCPPGLVDNWVDEILLWAPDKLLGTLSILDSSLHPMNRIKMIKNWHDEGGVLVSGYSLFTKLIETNGSVAEYLVNSPNIVIADEAHCLKNAKSQRHQAAAGFRTKSRIALTGSPLTKHVMDYYAMINWVAPGFLGDLSEFRARFENPIKVGLFMDSNESDKRIARKRLELLKATVDPLVNRKDIKVLHKELPPKTEFVLTLPLTEVQLKAYAAYREVLQSPVVELEGQTKIWSFVTALSTLLAHPQIFKKTLEQRKNSTPENAKGLDEFSAIRTIPVDLLSTTLATMALNKIADVEHSNKMRVLFAIVNQSRLVGDKVLIFSQSLLALDYLEQAFRQQRRIFKRLDGSTRPADRLHAVKNFNKDVDSEIYLISTRAGGVGLNITGANRVVIFDFRFTPMEEQQAIARSYRIGQTKPVFVYWLTVGGTFENAILNNAVFKTQLADRVVDKGKPDPKSSRNGEYFMQPSIPDQEDTSHVEGKDVVLDFLLKNPDMQGIVRKVITTDSYKEEESYELTPEDQKEVDEDIELERLRIHNPEEYKRRERENWTRLRGDAPPMSIPQPAPQPVLQPVSQPVPQSGPGSTLPPLAPRSSLPLALQAMPFQPMLIEPQIPGQVPPQWPRRPISPWSQWSPAAHQQVYPQRHPQMSQQAPFQPSQHPLEQMHQPVTPLSHIPQRPDDHIDQRLQNSPGTGVGQPSLSNSPTGTQMGAPSNGANSSAIVAPSNEARTDSPSHSSDSDSGQPTSGTSGLLPTPVFTRFLDSITPLNPTSAEQVAGLGPIRASGTHYKNGDPTHHDEVDHELQVMLEKQSHTIQAKGYQPVLDMNILMKQIDSYENSPDPASSADHKQLKLKQLKRILIQKPRMAETMLAGHFTLGHLLSETSGRLTAMAARLQDMKEDDFVSEVWKSQKKVGDKPSAYST